MNFITKFFHEFNNPHCEHCLQERLDAQHDEVVELLKLEIDRLQKDNSRLLDRLLNPIIEEKINTDELIPINRTLHKPWSVRRQELERNSRLERETLDKQILAKKVQETDDRTQTLENQIINAD